MTTAPSTNEPKSPAVQQTVTQERCTPRWWHPSRIAERLSNAFQSGVRSAFFMLVGATAVLLILPIIQARATNVRPRGVGPALAPGQSPGVQFLSELTPLFDVVSPETRVQVCFHGVDTDVGAPVVLIDHQTFTMRQFRDALKVVAALEPPVARQRPSIAASPVSTDVDAEKCPVWVDVDRDPPGIEIDRATGPCSSRD